MVLLYESHIKKIHIYISKSIIEVEMATKNFIELSQIQQKT